MATQPLNIIVDWAASGVAANLTYKVYSVDGTLRVTGTADAAECGSTGIYAKQVQWDPSWGLPLRSVWTDGVDTALGDETGKIDLMQVNGLASNVTALLNANSSILFDGDTAGGSTTTEIWLSDAYDATKAALYVGNYLVVPGVNGISARISAYTNQGGGASSVTVEAGKFSLAPNAGTAVQIIRSAGSVLRTVTVVQRNISVRD